MNQAKTLKTLLAAFSFLGLLILTLYPLHVVGPINIYDEGVWLATTQALLEGKQLYRDVWIQYGPVLPLALKAWVRLSSPTLETVRQGIWIFNVIGLACVYFCLWRYVASWKMRVLFSVLLFLVPLAAFSTHIPMAARYGAAFASVLFWPSKESSAVEIFRASVFAGIFAAVAYWISPEMGGAAFISGLVYLVVGFQNPKKPGVLFVSGFAFVMLVMMGVGTLSFGLKNYVQAVILDHRHVVFSQSLPLPSLRWDAQSGYLSALQKWVEGLAMYGALISYLLILLSACLKKVPRKSKALLVGLAVLGILMGVSAWVRPDRWHIYLAVTPALLLGAILADRFILSGKKRDAVFALGIILVSALMTVPQFLGYQQRLRKEKDFLEPDIPRVGKVLLPFSQAQGYKFILDWVEQNVPDGRPVLFFPYNGAFYFLANRPNPTSFPILAYAFNPQMEVRAISELGKSAPQWIIWDRDNVALDGVPIEKHLARVVGYIRENYVEQQTSGPFSFLLKRETN